MNAATIDPLPRIPSLRERFFVMALALTILCGLAAGRAEASSAQVLRFDAGRTDTARAMAVDAAGNIYVAGRVDDTTRPSSFAVIKYSAQGVFQWRSTYAAAAGEFSGEAFAVAVDASGNVVAAGYILRTVGSGSSVDWLTVSFSPAGVQRWAHRFDFGNAFEEAVSVAADSAGNVYVGGFYLGLPYFDWYLIKYASNGQVVWQKTRRGFNNGDDRITRVMMDPFGDLVVVGFTTNDTSGLRDFTLMKINPQGTEVFSKTYSIAKNRDDFPFDAAVDRIDGSIVVTGITSISPSGENPQIPFTARYDSVGEPKYVLSGDGMGGSSVAIDANSRVTVAGQSLRDVGIPGVTAVTRLAPSGTLLWTTTIPVPGKVALDASGNAFVAGTIQNLGSSDTSDYLMVKLNPSGAIVWTYRYSDGTSVADAAVDPIGDFVVTGNAPGGSFVDIATLKMTPDFVPPPDVPTAPGNLFASPGSSRQIVLSWHDNSGNETSFLIERCQGAGCTAFAQVATTGPDTGSFIDTGLAKKTIYVYRVRAANAAGSSAYSSTATAKTSN